MEAARAAGLLTADGLAVPLISDAVLARTPAGSRSELLRALAEIELGRGGNIRTAARGLLDAGMSGARAAAVFSAAAAEVLPAGGAEAGEFLDAAVRAGTPALELAARRAEAAVLADDLDVALTQADQVLAAPDRVPAEDLVRAGTAAAAVLARRGMLARSAELHRWMGAATGQASAIAVPALIGTGALDEAREVLRGSIPAVRPAGSPPALQPPSIRPPTLLAGAEELMAKGVYDSVAGSPTAALSELTRAAALLETSYRAALLPDTPAALAALVAVHCGEHDVAQSVLERAVRMRLGGPGAATRHRLLLGWIALSRGAVPAARAALQAASPPGRRAGAARRAAGRGAGGGAGPAHRRPGLADAGLGAGPGGHRAAPGGPVRAAAAGRAGHRGHPAARVQLGAPAPGRGRAAAGPARATRRCGRPRCTGRRCRRRSSPSPGTRRSGTRWRWRRRPTAAGTRPRWPPPRRTGCGCWTTRSTRPRWRRRPAGCTRWACPGRAASWPARRPSGPGTGRR